MAETSIANAQNTTSKLPPTGVYNDALESFRKVVAAKALLDAAKAKADEAKVVADKAAVAAKKAADNADAKTKLAVTAQKAADDAKAIADLDSKNSTKAKTAATKAKAATLVADQVKTAKVAASKAQIEADDAAEVYADALKNVAYAQNFFDEYGVVNTKAEAEILAAKQAAAAQAQAEADRLKAEAYAREVGEEAGASADKIKADKLAAAQAEADRLCLTEIKCIEDSIGKSLAAFDKATAEATYATKLSTDKLKAATLAKKAADDAKAAADADPKNIIKAKNATNKAKAATLADAEAKKAKDAATKAQIAANDIAEIYVDELKKLAYLNANTTVPGVPPRMVTITMTGDKLLVDEQLKFKLANHAKSTLSNVAYNLKLNVNDSRNLSSELLVWIDWGDGHSEEKTITNNNSTFQLSHTYNAVGLLTWNAIAVNLDTKETSKMLSGSITVKDRLSLLPQTGYTKVCNNGQYAGQGLCPKTPILGSSNDQWGCTRDNKAKLIWEIKTEKNKGNVSNWSDMSHNVFLCGSSSDWRVPTRDEFSNLIYCADGKYNKQTGELFSYLCKSNTLSKLITTTPTINKTYFPDIKDNHQYWTATSDVLDDDYAWFVDFYDGYSGTYPKSGYLYTRLVRTETETPKANVTSSDIESYQINCLPALRTETENKKVVSEKQIVSCSAETVLKVQNNSVIQTTE